MSISELNWFIDLAKSHPTAPAETKDLAKKISRALSSNHAGIEINRVFNSHPLLVQTTSTWLNDSDIGDSVKNKQCQITSNAYHVSLTAFNRILGGELPTKAWSLSKQTGKTTGFNKTLEANALARYLCSNKDLGYSERKAASIASEIFGVNADEIRHYDKVEPLNQASMTRIAYEAIMRYGDLAKAEKYFDVEILGEDATHESEEK